ncbi:hypothetical protein BBJ66_06780 [Rhizobium sp. RSm-3]|nr:hypothetical protein BBJ66_06780 [Rhizobium sp. RSm-3]
MLPECADITSFREVAELAASFATDISTGIFGSAHFSSLIPVLVTGIQPPRVCAVNSSIQQ